MSAPPPGRLSSYKHKGRVEDTRKTRQEEVVTLRKQKRHELTNKKRNIDDLETPSTNVSRSSVEIATQFEELRQQLNSDDLDQVHNAVSTIRALVSQPNDPPLTELCQSGCINKLVEFLSLKEPQYTSLQYQSVWCITNIAAGDTSHTQTLAEANAVPFLRELLIHGENNVKEQAAWALGNIAGDSETMRDYVIDCDVVEPLTRLIQTSSCVSLVRNASWAVTNLCRGTSPPPEFRKVKLFLSTLLKLVHSGDDEIIINGCWAAVFLSAGTNEKIQHVIETGVCAKLVELLLHDDWTVVTPALRALGNIVTGNDVQTQVVMNSSILPALHSVLKRAKRAVKKECLWVLSNIMAGTETQIQSVIDANLIQPIIDSLQHGDFRVQREAAWAICNAAASGTDDQIRFFMPMPLPVIYDITRMYLSTLCYVESAGRQTCWGIALDTNLFHLTILRSATVSTSLKCSCDTIASITKHSVGTSRNEYYDIIEQCGGLSFSSNYIYVASKVATSQPLGNLVTGLESLMMLAVDENENISRRSCLLLEKFLQPMEETLLELDPDFDGHMFAVDRMRLGHGPDLLCILQDLDGSLSAQE
eukprot:gene2832-5671_t